MNQNIENYFISIASPVYNEENNIESVINSWFRYIENSNLNVEVILCNDGSNDSTNEILESLEKRYEKLKVFRHKDNKGYGSAMLTAINNCEGDYIVTIDSDGQFDLRNIRHLFLQFNDTVVGVTGYRVRKKDSIIRIIADRALNIIVRVIFKVNLRDTNCALKIIKRETLKNINIESKGFSFPTEICLRIFNSGNTLKEIPIEHYRRSGDESKLKILSTGIYMFVFLIYLKLQFVLRKANAIEV